MATPTLQSMWLYTIENLLCCIRHNTACVKNNKKAQDPKGAEMCVKGHPALNRSFKNLLHLWLIFISFIMLSDDYVYGEKTITLM